MLKRFARRRDPGFAGIRRRPAGCSSRPRSSSSGCSWCCRSRWRSGSASPTGTATAARFGPHVDFVGLDNYRHLLTERRARPSATSARRCATTSTTCCSSSRSRRRWRSRLAVLVNRGGCEGAGFFRTAFYFPSVTSSVAITVLWLFLFSADRRRSTQSWLGRHQRAELVRRPARACSTCCSAPFGVDQAPGAARRRTTSSASPGGTGWPDPRSRCASLILMAVFTTSRDVHAALPRRAAEHRRGGRRGGHDGRRRRWQRFRHVTLPLLRPTLFTVLTLGLIGTWQVFDQIYAGTQGGPAKTTLTPAYLSYHTAFNEPAVGAGRGDRVHPVRDHRRVHARAALVHCAIATASRAGAAFGRDAAARLTPTDRAIAIGRPGERAVTDATRRRGRATAADRWLLYARPRRRSRSSTSSRS